MITLIYFLFSINASAESLSIPADVYQVVSADGQYEAKYSNASRTRFIVKNSLGGEGSASILIEKFAPGRYGAPDVIIQSKSLAVPSLPKVKEYIDQISKKSVEATYGCCGVSNIKWEDSRWSFTVQHSEKKFKCTVTSIESKDMKAACSE